MPLDSKLYPPESFETGINKKKELYNTNEINELLLNPGNMINCIGCHGSGKSEILSVLGLQLIKNKKIACITIDCHGCIDERSIVHCLLRTFNLNFTLLLEEWLDDDFQSQIQWNELMNWLSNYICFHGQIQLIILMFDGLNVDSHIGKNCVNKFFMPLLKRCISCLSILFCSTTNYLNVQEEHLATNDQISDGMPITDSKTLYERLINKNSKVVDSDKHELNLYAFKLQTTATDIMAYSLLENSSVSEENSRILVEMIAKHGLNLSAAKILAQSVAMKAGSFHHLLLKAESCSHPSLIIFENELATRQRKIESPVECNVHVNERFKIEQIIASIILATLETLDDEEGTMSTIMWAMSEFKSGFDLEDVMTVMSTFKFVENDHQWRMNLSDKIETNASSRESRENKQKILDAIARLVKLGLLQMVKAPLTFSSPLSLRRTSLNDPVAKPSRYFDQKKNAMDGSAIPLDKCFPKYRIPNTVMPIVCHLRPEFFGRPNLVFDYLTAKKLTALYQNFYSDETFGKALDDLDSIYSDFIGCIERNFVSEHDFDIMKCPSEFKVSHPIIHACQSLTSLPGALFLAHILPFSAYMKIFQGISDMVKQKSVTKITTDFSLEYRALLCIILRHKMASFAKDTQNKKLSTTNGVNYSMKDDVKEKHHVNVSSNIGLSHKEVDSPINLFNFSEGISCSSQLDEAVIADMISKIKFHLFQVNKSDRAYFYYIMGIHLWSTDQDHALTLMKKSLDFFKESKTDHADEILPNCGQVCIQIVCETYSWMLLSTDRIQAARHMYNLTDSLSSSSASSSPLSPTIISQNSFQVSSSSSYYSLHSYHGFSPLSGGSRNEEDYRCIIDGGGNADKRNSVCILRDCQNNLMNVDKRKNDDQTVIPSNTQTEKSFTSNGDVFEKILENNESLAILARCRNTLKSMNDSNFCYSRNTTSKTNFITLDRHPLKLRGLECRRKIWSELGLLSRARDSAKSCVELSKRWWGRDHPSTSDALMGQCLVAERLGRNHEAIDACVQALLCRLKFFGDRHGSSAESCIVLARLLLKCSMYDECLELSRRALNMTTHLCPPRDDHMVEAARIMETAERKLKAEKIKGDPTSAATSKSVTFHPDDLVIGRNADDDFIRGGGNIIIKDSVTCSSTICTFDPELALTFHRCVQVPTIA